MIKTYFRNKAHPEVLAFQMSKAAEGGEAGVKLSAVLRELRDNGKEAGILDYGVMQVRFGNIVLGFRP
jgi:hypothetical protein